MSNFKMQKIGTYKYTYNKMGEPMVAISLDPVELKKVKDWDLGKVYIYKPQKAGGDVIGLVGSE